MLAHVVAQRPAESAGPADPAAADAALAAALRRNAAVPTYLLGEAAIDGGFPSSAGPSGSEEEAVAVASCLFDVWQLVPGAVDWCRRVRDSVTAAVGAAGSAAAATAVEGDVASVATTD